MAAIHTDTHPLSNVRGKCYVRHKDRIDNLLAWKKMPDHFYFTKFFDPYIKREYEVLRTESVQNSESVGWTELTFSPATCQSCPHVAVRVPGDGERDGQRPHRQLSELFTLSKVGCKPGVCPLRVRA